MNTPAGQKPAMPQAPGAPGWKEKPKAAAGAFAGVVLVAGLFVALGPSEGGRMLKPYLDSARIPTACLGIIGTEVTRRYKAGLTFTDAECQSLESVYLGRMVEQMSRCIPADVQATTSYGEMVSFGHWNYNTGAFCASSVAKTLARGDRVGACRAMGQWTWITRPASAGVPRGVNKPVLNGTGRVTSYRMQCTDPLNRCSGLAKRRELEVTSCLEAL